MANTTKIKPADVCGPHCVAIDDGRFLLEKIRTLLKVYTLISLDFTGVLTITTSFLNASIGKLIGELSIGEFKRRVQWDGLDENDNQLMNLVIRNAQSHFQKSAAEKDKENQITRRIIENI